MSQRIILRLNSVVQQTGRSRSSTYRDIDLGLMTPPVDIGARSVGWPSDEIEAINNARVAGWSGDQIKKLVQQLISKRTQSEVTL